MTEKIPFPQLREQAIALRRAGKSRMQIKEILNIGSNETLSRALRGEPPPQWTQRPRAKDERRARARELREQGFDYKHIAAELGVSKSSVSLWVRDMPVPERLSYEECRKRANEQIEKYWAVERPIRAARRQAAVAAARATIGSHLSDRELFIAGAIAYWCEGTKNKPWNRHDRVTFINSDPDMIRLFLRFLTTAGVSPDRLIFQVFIHESADVEAAKRFWLVLTGAPATQFRQPQLKRHNPRTVRKNTGDSYHGCLRIYVRHSADLYRQIEGWAAAVMTVSAGGTSEHR